MHRNLACLLFLALTCASTLPATSKRSRDFDREAYLRSDDDDAGAAETVTLSAREYEMLKREAAANRRPRRRWEAYVPYGVPHVVPVPARFPGPLPNPALANHQLLNVLGSGKAAPILALGAVGAVVSVAIATDVQKQHQRKAELQQRKKDMQAAAAVAANRPKHEITQEELAKEYEEQQRKKARERAGEEN